MLKLKAFSFFTMMIVISAFIYSLFSIQFLKASDILAFKTESYGSAISRNEEFLDYDKKVQEIMNANKVGSCTIISAANYGHRFFTLNWITSLEMNQFNKFVVFSYDDELIQFLSEKGYANRTIKIPNFLLEKNVTTDSSDFMTPNFLALVQSRSKLFLKLLELGIAFLFSDVDTVWMSNRVVEYVEFVYKHSYAEILFSEDTVARRNHYNTGFFYATPTNFTINLYKMLIDEQRKNPGILTNLH